MAAAAGKGSHLQFSSNEAVSSSHSNSGVPLIPRDRILPFILVTALFFLWGVPNNFNDILIRQFMTSFEISRLQASLVQFAFYMGYFLLAVPAGIIMRRAGYKAGILIGLCLFGAGCILFWPAALVAQPVQHVPHPTTASRTITDDQRPWLPVESGVSAVETGVSATDVTGTPD